MDIRYYMDPTTQVPHIRRHGVAEHETASRLTRVFSLTPLSAGVEANNRMQRRCRNNGYTKAGGEQ